MEFVRSIKGYDHLWAVKYPEKETDVYIVTGGAIKLTPSMQDRPHTMLELQKLNKCRDYLKQNGVFDQDSFIDYICEYSHDQQSDQVSGGTPE